MKKTFGSGMKPNVLVYISFILPGLLLYLVFILIPIAATALNSLTQWDGVGEKVFIGFSNFSKLLTDPIYAPQLLRALKNGLWFVALSFAIQMPTAVYFAYMIDKYLNIGELFKFIIFLPQVLSMVSVSVMALLFFDPNFGSLNNVLLQLGLESLTRSWLGAGKYLRMIVPLLLSWKGVGIPVMLILSNLKSIPKEYIEAATIDGANEFTRFRIILLPLLAPSLTTSSVLMYLGAIGVFDIPFLVGDKHGGPGGVVDTLGTLFYRISFGSPYLNNNIGLGTAVAVIQFLVMMVVSTLIVRVRRSKEMELS
jgi:raffinose/stachyose/melibiose transport system permease protein